MTGRKQAEELIEFYMDPAGRLGFRTEGLLRDY